MSGPSGGAGTLIEVAVALPVTGTFTYRDPRGGGGLPPGTEVVVPFGGRRVTGFVLGPAAEASTESPASSASSARRARDIEAVVGSEPAFDQEMLGLCRWGADYYQAPLGELLRAALPQGERAAAIRMVRLTAAGVRVARGEVEPAAQATLAGMEAASGVGGGGGGGRAGATGAGAASGADAAPSLLRALAEVGGEIAWRLLARRAGTPAMRALPRLEAAGLVEVGDQVRDRQQAPTAAVVVAVAAAAAVAGPAGVAGAAGSAGKAALPSRARARRALLDKVTGAPGGEIAAAALSAAERVHVRALEAAGLVRVEHRPAAVASPGAAAGIAAMAGVARDRRASPLPPTPAQAEAIAVLTAALGGGFATFLLQGVTGSGKTEVYLQVIAAARAAGRGALVLVPEIALTPQLASRFQARFGDDVAVLHSALPARARLAAWRRLRAGEVGIALGARSAVFAPVRALGVVVVDEEHDPSFKQEEGVRYHGRDMAVVRAQRAEAVAVLGSATPSLESYRNAELGRFRRLLLPVRATPRPLPPVEIVDLRRHPPGPDGLLSAPLAEAVAANLAAGQQSILFLNRRGFSTVALCRACGHVVRCNQCAVSLTYHRSRERMVCHYCGLEQAVPDTCPACRRRTVERLGMGTERVEALVRERFPGARVARLDRDTAGAGAGGRGPPASSSAPGEGALVHGGGHRGLENVLRGMQAGEIDILVGTQMVTKGHDFGGVTLVGVLQPDQAMNLPDFRAAERVFQLLEQVAGRAGRGDRPGRVIVQTYCPEHAAIVAVQSHDYEGFVRGELAQRAELGYPPSARMVLLRLDGPDEARVRTEAAAAATAARAAGGGRVRLLGPAEAPIPRVRGRSRFQIWLSAADRAPLVAAARAAAALRLGGGVRLVVDVDPQSAL